MKITLRELKQLIRESVQEEIQKEGLMDTVKGFFGGKSKGIFASDPDFRKNLSGAIRKYLEKNLSNAKERDNTVDSRKFLEQAIKNIRDDVPTEENRYYEDFKYLITQKLFHSSRDPEGIGGQLTAALKKSGGVITKEDIDSFKQMLDSWEQLIGTLERMETVETVNKESVQAMVREEVKRQLRSKR